MLIVLQETKQVAVSGLPSPSGFLTVPISTSQGVLAQEIRIFFTSLEESVHFKNIDVSACTGWLTFYSGKFLKTAKKMNILSTCVS